jgi:hypothetical protein
MGYIEIEEAYAKGQAEPAAVRLELKKVFQQLGQSAIEMIPGIGDIISLKEVTTGETHPLFGQKQEKLGKIGRILAGLALVPLVPNIGKFNIKLNTWKGSIIPIWKNPTRKDYKEAFKRFYDKYPEAKDKYVGVRLRSTIDTEGNEYIWMAGDATHEMVESQLKRIHNITANQNAIFDLK